MRHMRQCCGSECNNNTHCEEDAWRRYQKQRMLSYKKMLTSNVFQYIIIFTIGFIIGKIL